MLFYHKGLRGCKTTLPIVAYARKAAILRGQIWSAHASDVVGLRHPDGIIAFDPSSFPKRGTHSVGVKRQWCGHRGKVDNCQVGVFMGYVADDEHALLDFRLWLPEEWAREEHRREDCHVPPEVRYQTRH